MITYTGQSKPIKRLVNAVNGLFAAFNVTDTQIRRAVENAYVVVFGGTVAAEYVAVPYVNSSSASALYAEGERIGTVNGNPVRVAQNYLDTAYKIGAYKSGGAVYLAFAGTQFDINDTAMSWHVLSQNGELCALSGEARGSFQDSFWHTSAHDAALDTIAYDITVFDTEEECLEVLKEAIR